MDGGWVAHLLGALLLGQGARLPVCLPSCTCHPCLGIMPLAITGGPAPAGWAEADAGSGREGGCSGLCCKYLSYVFGTCDSGLHCTSSLVSET